MIVIPNESFQLIQQLDRATENDQQRKRLKYSLLDRLATVLGRAFRNARKVAAVIDEIVYKATDRGYSFNGRETLAEKTGVSLRTVDNAIKLLKASAEVVVAYRENPGSNGVKTPVIIFRNHPNFDRIARLLNLPDCEVVCEVEKAPELTETSDRPTKNVATYLLPLKQERDIIKIRSIIEHKINDAIKKGTTIKYISSYVNRVFKSMERKAIYAENRKQIEARRQLQRQREEQFRPKIPFYNWLGES